MNQTKADPTGQLKNRNRSSRRLSKRLTNAESQVKRLFRDIPRTRHTKVAVTNAKKTTTFYQYDFDQDQFETDVTIIVNNELLETQVGSMPFDWWWKADVELPYRQGALVELREFNRLISATNTPPVTEDQILLSEPYRTGLETEQVKNFNIMKSLSQTVSSQTVSRVSSDIAAGKTPTAIIEEIVGRFDVGRSYGDANARTYINEAYNNAKMGVIDTIGQVTGLRPAVLHVSALSTTTRESHADRHGNAYTIEDQLQWWNTVPNRRNCKCTVKSVLLDSQGRVVQSELQDELREERSYFESEQ